MEKISRIMQPSPGMVNMRSWIFQGRLGINHEFMVNGSELEYRLGSMANTRGYEEFLTSNLNSIRDAIYEELEIKKIYPSGVGVIPLFRYEDLKKFILEGEKK